MKGMQVVGDFTRRIFALATLTLYLPAGLELYNYLPLFYFAHAAPPIEVPSDAPMLSTEQLAWLGQPDTVKLGAAVPRGIQTIEQADAKQVDTESATNLVVASVHTRSTETPQVPVEELVRHSASAPWGRHPSNVKYSDRLSVAKLVERKISGNSSAMPQESLAKQFVIKRRKGTATENVTNQSHRAMAVPIQRRNKYLTTLTLH